jgi:nucleoid-associated protein YgaU
MRRTALVIIAGGTGLGLAAVTLPLVIPARAGLPGNQADSTLRRPFDGGSAQRPSEPIGGARDVAGELPSFRRVLRDGPVVVIEGRGAPGTDIVVEIDDTSAGRVRIGDDGVWRLPLARALTPGDHNFSVVVPGRDVAAADNAPRVDRLRVAIPERWPAGGLSLAPNGRRIAAAGGRDEAVRDEVRRRAEELGRAASGRFDDVLRGAEPPKSAVLRPLPQGGGDPAIEQSTERGEGDVRRLIEELRRRRAERLRTAQQAPPPAPKAPVAPQVTSPAVPPQVTPAPPPGSESWLDRARRDYQELMRRLSVDQGGQRPDPVRDAQKRIDDRNRADAEKAARDKAEADQRAAAAKTQQDEAKRKADEQRAAEAKKKDADEAARRQAEAQRADALKKEAEAKRAADEQRAAEAKKREADEAARRQAEAQRADALKKEAEAKRAADEQRAAEAKKREADEAARRQAEAQRADALKREAEAKRAADEQRAAEAKKREADEAARRQAEAQKAAPKTPPAPPVAQPAPAIPPPAQINPPTPASTALDAQQRGLIARAEADLKRTADLARQATEQAQRARATADAADARRANDARVADDLRRAAQTAAAQDRAVFEQRVAEASRRADESRQLAERAKAEAETRAKAAERVAAAQRTADRTAQALRTATIAASGAVSSAARREAQRMVTSEARNAADAVKTAERAMSATTPPVAQSGSGAASGRTAAVDGAAQSGQGSARRGKKRRPATIVASSSTKAPGGSNGPCRLTSRKVSLPGWYRVRRGDTLWSIAARHYGDGRRYGLIFTTNRRRIEDADLIYPCQRIYLPAA